MFVKQKILIGCYIDLNDFDQNVILAHAYFSCNRIITKYEISAQIALKNLHRPTGLVIWPLDRPTGHYILPSASSLIRLFLL